MPDFGGSIGVSAAEAIAKLSSAVAEMNPLVCLKNASKRFAGREIISSLNLRIDPGEVIGICGPSGSGKTTILKMIAGLLEPSAGQVINNAGTVGYVFQEHRLLPWKTVLDNLVLPLKACGCDKAAARKHGLSHLEKVELAGFEDYYPGQLSGGMLQRVALARAVSVDPDLLILDEAFNAMDAALSKKVQSFLAELIAEKKMTVIAVSHRPGDLAKIMDRRLHLDKFEDKSLFV
jgi:NitT/TauT family transport system ATP-binding protein